VGSVGCGCAGEKTSFVRAGSRAGLGVLFPDAPLGQRDVGAVRPTSGRGPHQLYDLAASRSDDVARDVAQAVWPPAGPEQVHGLSERNGAPPITDAGRSGRSHDVGPRRILKLEDLRRNQDADDHYRGPGRPYDRYQAVGQAAWRDQAE